LIAVRAIYDGRQVKYLENIPVTRLTKIIVAFLEDEPLSDGVEISKAEELTPLDLFDHLVGIISEQNDGSVNHNKYIYSKEDL